MRYRSAIAQGSSPAALARSIFPERVFAPTMFGLCLTEALMSQSRFFTESGS
ncbi:hypothetical protein NSQ77_04120 [Oceanobacillus sp. FSL K6-2867]|uniref:hypothetical protein n=1 Tax=Oceanobacillus sp. FSL K6-2867 TaxID=2954748 RepID=UPI0030D71D98